MHISKLSIENFRNFGDPPFEIQLKPFTLLLGENNVGKTNLLAAVSLLFGQEISVAQRRVLELDDIILAHETQQSTLASSDRWRGTTFLNCAPPIHTAHHFRKPSAAVVV